MAGRSVPDTSRDDRDDDAPTALVLPPPIDPPAPALPTLTPPDLCRQLRGMFFARTFQDYGAEISHPELLRLGAAVYGHEFWRRVTYEENRIRGYEGLDLYIFRDAFDDLGVPLPDGPDEYPPELRLVAAVLEFNPEMLVMNPLYIPTAADVAWARANRFSPCAWGVAVNQHHVPSEENITYARENPRTSFSLGIFANPNFIPTRADIDSARQEVRYGVAENPNFTPEPEDIAFARADVNSPFSCRLASNQNFVPTGVDVDLARANRRNSFAASIMRRPMVVPSAEDVSYALSNLTVPFSQGVVLNPNFIPIDDHIELALANPHTPVAGSMAVNPNFVPTADHFARANPQSNFAWGLVENLTVFLRLTRTHAA